MLVFGAEKTREDFLSGTGLSLFFSMQRTGFVFSTGENENVWKNASKFEVDYHDIHRIIVPGCLSENVGGLTALPGGDEVKAYAHPHLVLNGVVSQENLGKTSLITRDAPTMLSDDVWILGDLPEGAGPDGEMWLVLVVQDEIILLSAGIPFGLSPLLKHTARLFPDLPVTIIGEVYHKSNNDSEVSELLKSYPVKAIYTLTEDSFDQKVHPDIKIELLHAGDILKFGKG